MLRNFWIFELENDTGDTRPPVARLSVPIPYKVASLNIESSNQLFETLEEWNDFLDADAPLVLQARRPQILRWASS
jgi:hypothetical protein